VRAFRAGAASVEAVLAMLGGTETYRGLAGTYVFQPDGELTRSSAPVRLYRDEGRRWIPLRSPVGTHAG